MPTKKRAKRKPAVALPPRKPDYLRMSDFTIERRFFEEYFWLDGPGRVIMLDALAAGEISTPYEAVDFLCIVNKLHLRNVHELIAAELRALGHTEDYREAETHAEAQRLMSEAFAILGDDRVRTIFTEAARRARKLLNIPETNTEWLPWFLTAPVQ